jgi:hypothetical protein
MRKKKNGSEWDLKWKNKVNFEFSKEMKNNNWYYKYKNHITINQLETWKTSESKASPSKIVWLFA